MSGEKEGIRRVVSGEKGEKRGRQHGLKPILRDSSPDFTSGASKKFR